ncbi:MAG: DNA polymerase III subunit delta', partial [Gammaproteobacteria bacterium]|nr:DNA polymerase III subunit delta' [Gammaproteobacteria bacterium]
PAGTGKQRFAAALAARLLCAGAGERPCGACRSCHLAGAGTHPDLHAVSPEEDRRQIGIEQIRALIEQVGLTAHFGGAKVVVLHPAEMMTRAAANTLLKTLEEPPGDSVFVLVADAASRLPATVRSRCQIVDFPLPAAAQALPWLAERLGGAGEPERLLALADGAPMAALALAEGGGLATREAVLEDVLALIAGRGDPVSTAARWEKLGPGGVLAWLGSLTCDAIRLKNGRTAHKLTHADRASAMHDLARGLDLKALFEVLDLVTEASRAVAGRASLNELLLLERITIAWSRLACSRGRAG